jgi:hypothetical protein
MITSKLVVERERQTKYGSVAQGTFKGSGYCEDQQDVQNLIKEWRLFGVRIWSIRLDYEIVPDYAIAQAACLGFTDWKSKFYEFI